jgi:hypothetical protein
VSSNRSAVSSILNTENVLPQARAYMGLAAANKPSHKEDDIMQIDWTDPRLVAGAVAVVVMLVLGIVLAVRWKRHKTACLRERFGPEYDQAVLTHGSAGRAEAKLVSREARVGKLKLRDLSIGQRERFVAGWTQAQSHFVDHPKASVTEADELVSRLMLERGYPDAAFDQRAADISVNHPRLVQSFRAAHEIEARVGKDDASTEDLRVAMVQYRTVFEELIEVRAPSGIKAVA